MRTIVFHLKLCLAVCGLLHFAQSSLEAQSPDQKPQKAISDTAKRNISKAIAANPNNVLIFDAQGNVKASTPLTEDDLRRYGSLEQFLRSEKSPVSDCKKPTPVPPPPCILCDDGRIVCSGAKFKGPG